MKGYLFFKASVLSASILAVSLCPALVRADSASMSETYAGKMTVKSSFDAADPGMYDSYMVTSYKGSLKANFSMSRNAEDPVISPKKRGTIEVTIGDWTFTRSFSGSSSSKPRTIRLSPARGGTATLTISSNSIKLSVSTPTGSGSGQARSAVFGGSDGSDPLAGGGLADSLETGVNRFSAADETASVFVSFTLSTDEGDFQRSGSFALRGSATKVEKTDSEDNTYSYISKGSVSGKGSLDGGGGWDSPY